MTLQLDLFKTEKEALVDSLKDEVERLRKSNDRVRKGLFARHNELAKHYLELRGEFEDWKRSICRDDSFLKEVV